MKKLALIILLIAAVLGGTALLHNINFPMKLVNSAARPDVDLAFAVLGDVHENIDSLQKAIEDLHNINPAMDALVLNGDTVDQGLEEQYASLNKALQKNKSNLPKTIIKNIGNHEFFNYAIETNSAEEVQAFINRYLQFAGEKNVYHDTWVNNYHFISLGSEDGNSQTLDSITAYLSDTQLKWLKQKLGENYVKGKPMFLFLHQPLGNNGRWGVKQANEIKEILNQYPEIIVFGSHTHRDLDASSVTINQPFTMVHTGAVHYTIVPDPKNPGKTAREPFIKGVYIVVKGNQVVIRGRDLKEKKWIFTQELPKKAQ